MKKILSATCAMMLASAGMMANAQQLPNVGFDAWKTACGETFGMDGNTGYRQRPGVEPQDWNGSSVNQTVVGMNKQQVLVSNVDGAVQLQNIFVGVSFGSMKIGSVAPGYLTLGTPWVYAEMTISNCDGGTFGGVEFTSKPDAIKGQFKRTDTNDENSYIIAYLWNGSFKSKIGKKGSPSETFENVERAILGKVTPDETAGKLVASCEHLLKPTNSDWQTIEVPFIYDEEAGDPTMMNVIISAGDYWERGNLKENTTLLVDDVHFVYYSRLKSLKLNGVEVEGFSPDVYEYTVEGTKEVAFESELMSQFTTAKTEVHYNDYGYPEYATILVGRFAENGELLSGEYKDVDDATSHEYRINFSYHNSRLASLKVNDAEVKDFNSNTYSYYVAGEVPVIEKVEAVAVDPEATVEMTRDEEAATVSIVVTNPNGVDEDGESSHTYVLNFQKFYTPVGQKYDGTLTIQLGDGEPFSMEDQSVYIDVKEDGTCTFGLYQFAMGPGMVLGDIVVENVTIGSDENGNTTYNGEKKDIVLFLNGSPIFADATVFGTEDAERNLTMTIPVIWKTGIGDAAPMMTINVTFNGKKDTGAGVESVAGDGVKVYAAAGCVVVEGAEGVAQVYTADGKQVAAKVVNGKAEIALANGLYIVRVGNKVQKVVVK